jgi:hypothetical protein
LANHGEKEKKSSVHVKETSRRESLDGSWLLQTAHKIDNNALVRMTSFLLEKKQKSDGFFSWNSYAAVKKPSRRGRLSFTENMD